MDEQIKLNIIIITLKKLGYTRDQIEKGINMLDEDKYDGMIDINTITKDIINNIEKGDK